MSYASLRDFMERLEKAGQLVRVAEAVSPELEMTEIQTRLLAEGGPAVLFETVVGAAGRHFDMPVLVNLFGTVERVAMGMNRQVGDLRQLGDMLAFLKQPEPPGGWRQAMDMWPMLKTVLSMKPKTTARAPVPRRGAGGRTRSTSAACRSRPAGRASRRPSSPGPWW